MRLATLVRTNFPEVRLIARAHNRFSVQLYKQLGVHEVIREMMEGSLDAAEQVLSEYGFGEVESGNMVQIFRHHDKESVEEAGVTDLDIDTLVTRASLSREELANLFQKDRTEISPSP